MALNCQRSTCFCLLSLEVFYLNLILRDVKLYLVSMCVYKTTVTHYTRVTITSLRSKVSVESFGLLERRAQDLHHSSFPSLRAFMFSLLLCIVQGNSQLGSWPVLKPLRREVAWQFTAY